MSREWKGGDPEVAIVSWRSPSRHGGTNMALRCSRDYGSTFWRTQMFGEIDDANVTDVRPLVVIDPEDREAVERLARAVVQYATPVQIKHDASRGAHIEWRVSDLSTALREFANPKPRCVAHGEAACPECSRIRTVDFSGGECLHCSVYGTDGMHWDTCPGRIRGPVFASRDEAMEARP